MNETEKTPSSILEIRKANSAQLAQMGGKAATLAKLLKLDFPVPPGISVLSSHLQEFEWGQLQQAAEKNKLFPVAVRSSAQGEDGNEVSYAGQFKTFLNVQDKEALTNAVVQCFESVKRPSSLSYAAHFDRAEIPMRVLVQKMIDPQFSGVYFSHDPRNQSSGWMIETIEGLGEKLVSAQVTPIRIFEKSESTNFSHWKSEFTQQIVSWARKVEQVLNYQIDMEWAIDHDGVFWILQVRPITTEKSSANANSILESELARLKTKSTAITVWDGHSFAELSGVPCELTYQIWGNAFAPGKAFDKALKELGYTGLKSNSGSSSNPNFGASISTTENNPLLERVFGRSYLNLTRLEPVYFGESPYRIAPSPRPHLVFELNRMTPRLLLKGPAGIYKMLKVAWRIQTQRKELSKKAEKYLQNDIYAHLSTHEIYAEALKRPAKEQLDYIKRLVSDFSETHLVSTFLITLLIESTTQGILALLSKDLGEKSAQEESQHFMGENLKTISNEMSQSLIQAHDSKENWDSFISQFGHRGLGEMELSNPRWIETPQVVRVRKNLTPSNTQLQKSVDQSLHREQILAQISKLRKPLLLQELNELQVLLQLREKIKMQVMKPYADIRWSLLSWAGTLDIGWNSPNNIFWLNMDEILSLTEKNKSQDKQKILALIKNRKDLAKVYRSVELPMSFSAADLEEILSPRQTQKSQTLLGVSLSPGIASGVVHIVQNPETEDLSRWPENTILVAEATDPGWTPLFERAKAVIVSRGGILSHCAIVAREMGLPAVGEILGAKDILKEGEYVWVDGVHGTIRRTT